MRELPLRAVAEKADTESTEGRRTRRKKEEEENRERIIRVEG